MANRTNSSDLTTRWTTNVVNMLCHRQGRVNVNPEAFDMAFERNIMTVNSQMTILWHTDPPTRSNYKRLSFIIVKLQSIASHPTPNRINTLLDVMNQWMKVGWSWWFVELNVVSKFVMIAFSLRNDVRQWLRIRSKEYWAQDRTLRNPVTKLLLWRDPTVDADRLESIRQIRWKPFKSLAIYAKHVMQACKENAKVRMETRPSLALPRRQFITSLSCS